MISASTRISVPGSLLIAGEYRITEQDGLGMAAAAGGRAYFSPPIHAAGKECIEASWPGGGYTWKGSHSEGTAASVRLLPDYVTEILRQKRRVSFHTDTSGILDTGEFFGSDGHKRGYGSSAAAAVLLSSVFSRSLDEEVLQAALDAHRAFQDGAGSGYDVYCSYFGGCGVFTGGKKPCWKEVLWPADLIGWILRGPAPIGSGGSIRAYLSWKSSHPVQQESFAQESDRIVMSLVAKTGQDKEFLSVLTEAAALGIDLGEAIGVSARPDLSLSLGSDLISNTRSGAALKSLGAGNETVLLLCEEGALTQRERRQLDAAVNTGSAELLRVDLEGLREDAR